MVIMSRVQRDLYHLGLASSVRICLERFVNGRKTVGKEIQPPMTNFISTLMNCLGQMFDFQRSVKATRIVDEGILSPIATLLMIELMRNGASNSPWTVRPGHFRNAENWRLKGLK
jgi:hypothetical protein